MNVINARLARKRRAAGTRIVPGTSTRQTINLGSNRLVLTKMRAGKKEKEKTTKKRKKAAGPRKPAVESQDRAPRSAEKEGGDKLPRKPKKKSKRPFAPEGIREMTGKTQDGILTMPTNIHGVVDFKVGRSGAMGGKAPSARTLKALGFALRPKKGKKGTP